MTPFDVWAPIFRAPFSGNVTQEIAPQLFSPNIQGVPEIEHKIQTEVASYGKQLGKIIEALKILAGDEEKIPEIYQLSKDIEAAKADCRTELQNHATKALVRLRDADPDALKQLLREAMKEEPPKD